MTQSSPTNPHIDYYQAPSIGYTRKVGYTPAEIVNDAYLRIPTRANFERPVLIALRNRGIPGAEELLRIRDRKLVLVANNFIADQSILTEYTKIDKKRMLITLEGKKLLFVKSTMPQINLHYLYAQSPCLTHITFTDDAQNYLDIANHQAMALFPESYSEYISIEKYKPNDVGAVINLIWSLVTLHNRLAKTNIAFVESMNLYIHPVNNTPAILDFTNAVLTREKALPIPEFPVEIRSDVLTKIAFVGVCMAFIDLPWTDADRLRIKKTISMSFDVDI